jgi:transcriptional regulator with GAF, ATPase, and Fis domain
VAARQFREDLYFRLSVFPIVVPPLRDRRDDIPILARHFLDRLCREVKKRVTLSAAAIAALQRYDWPGNVRELQNCIERAIILTSADTIQSGHLHLEGGVRQMSERAEAGRWEGFDWSGTLDEVARRAAAEAEQHKLVMALSDARGNRAQAAGALGIPLSTLDALLSERRPGEE